MSLATLLAKQLSTRQAKYGSAGIRLSNHLPDLIASSFTRLGDECHQS